MKSRRRPRWRHSKWALLRWMSKRSNCFIFAHWLWYLHYFKGHVSYRQSRHITGLHWMYSKDLKERNWLHYSPVSPKAHWWKAIFHKIWFEGKVKRGDDLPGPG